MLTLEFEAIHATQRHEFISVRVWSTTDGHRTNCGLLVFTIEQFAALALRPPTSELVQVACSLTGGGGDIHSFLEDLLGAHTTAA